MENIFELNNVCKSYKDFSLKNVNLALPKGYIMGFVGANGAGKSTTINCLLGLSKIKMKQSKFNHLKNMGKQYHHHIQLYLHLLIQFL